jgi:hypothetical protein
MGEGAPRFPSFVNFSAFAQDTWRVTPRMTLTYGLRWELNPPPSERRGNHPLFIALRAGGPANPELAPPGTPLWETSYGDFAPRAGAAYQLSQGRGTVLRGGVGLFYDLGTGQAAQAFGSVFPYASTWRVGQAALPLAQAQTPPAMRGAVRTIFDAVYAFDPRQRLPYALRWSAALEQPLGRGQAVSAAYVAAAGRRLPREVVHPLGERFREVRTVTNTAASDYHAMQLQFQRRAAEGLQATAVYTWARALDDTSEESSLSAPVRAGAPPTRGPSSFDVRHSLAAAVTYEVPAPRPGARGAALLRGWTVDAAFKARTATPFSVVISSEMSNGDLAELTYPDYVPGTPIYVSDPLAAGRRRVNRAAFQHQSTGQGLGRNSLRGFGFAQLDVGLRRRFQLSERLRLQLRAEVFNALNRANFGNPVGDLRSSLFGQSVQTLAGSLGSGGVNGGLSPAYQVGGPRSAQLSLKVQF